MGGLFSAILYGIDENIYGRKSKADDVALHGQDGFDSVAFLARLEGCDHARIVLIGGEDFIAGLEIKTEEAGFE